MRSTTNTANGLPFRFNGTVWTKEDGQVIAMPARFGRRRGCSYMNEYMVPSKTPHATLRKLNPGRVILVRAGEASERLMIKHITVPRGVQRRLEDLKAPELSYAEVKELATGRPHDPDDVAAMVAHDAAVNLFHI